MFYTFGDRFIVADKAGTLVVWEATLPMPTSIPEIALHDGLSIYCFGIDSALCKICLIYNIPRHWVILQTSPLDCTPPEYQLQMQSCTIITDLSRCIKCQNGNICLFLSSIKPQEPTTHSGRLQLPTAICKGRCKQRSIRVH